MAAPTVEDATDLLRALAIIRGHETKHSPDLVYTRIVAEYAEYRTRDVSHTSAMRVVSNRLFERYPHAPALLSVA
jgi:hypothetical protein